MATERGGDINILCKHIIPILTPDQVFIIGARGIAPHGLASDGQHFGLGVGNVLQAPALNDHDGRRGRRV